MSRIKDKTGERYGRLTVTEFVGTDENGRSLWACECDCGNASIVNSSHLNATGIKSCGCLRIDNIRKTLGLPPGEASFNDLFNQYKRDARKRGLVFSLSKLELRELAISTCHYCGAEPSREHNPKWTDNGTFLCNGIDRKNNDEGYTQENCVTCCWDCNFLKRGLSYSDFLCRVKKIASHLVELGCNNASL